MITRTRIGNVLVVKAGIIRLGAIGRNSAGYDIRKVGLAACLKTVVNHTTEEGAVQNLIDAARQFNSELSSGFAFEEPTENPCANKKFFTRAEAIVDNYTFVIIPSDELGYVAHVKEMPLITADDPDRLKCLAKLQDNAIAAVITMFENGQEIPTKDQTEIVA